MSLLKYPGGKESELQYILPKLPENIENFYEPFVGGGSVYLCPSLNAQKYFINDKSQELINLYTCLKEGNEDFFAAMKNINSLWKQLAAVLNKKRQFLIDLYLSYRQKHVSDSQIAAAIDKAIEDYFAAYIAEFTACFPHYPENLKKEIRINVTRKVKRMCLLENKQGMLPTDDIFSNIECAFKSAFYMQFRFYLNRAEKMKESNGFHAAVYLFIRDMCYSSMFRYNSSGEFNVPYGGISYNRKSFDLRIEQYRSQDLLARLQRTEIGCSDFYDFMLRHPVSSNDFVFLDPPYDTEFSEYAQNKFEKDDQKRLADYLLNHCVGNFMLIIKNTDFIFALYPEGYVCANGKPLVVESFSKKYLVSFKNRNIRDAEHLMITNY